MEDQLIRKIKGGMMGMRSGTKSASEVGPLLSKLLPINKMMYEDLLSQYKKLLNELKLQK